jgi:uncharacterized protein YdaT
MANNKWTFENFHIKLNALRPDVRAKAIVIANELMRQKKCSENQAIEEGIKKAEEWFLDTEG